MVDVDVEGVLGHRLSLAVLGQHLPDDVTSEEDVATRVAADGVGQLGVELLDMVQVNGQGNLERERSI